MRKTFFVLWRYNLDNKYVKIIRKLLIQDNVLFYMLQPIKKYAQFTGRARRKEFFGFLWFSTSVSCFLVLTGGSFQNSLLIGLGLIFLIMSIIPMTAVAVRRLHDIGKSGYYCITPLIIYLVYLEGEKGENRYGPDPKEEL